MSEFEYPSTVKKLELGPCLKACRQKNDLSQGDVAHHLRLKSAQSISDWERGYGSAIPIKALKKLISLYKMDEDVVFEKFLEFKVAKLEEKLRSLFYGRQTKKPRR